MFLRVCMLVDLNNGSRIQWYMYTHQQTAKNRLYNLELCRDVELHITREVQTDPQDFIADVGEVRKLARADEASDATNKRTEDTLHER